MASFLPADTFTLQIVQRKNIDFLCIIYQISPSSTTGDLSAHVMFELIGALVIQVHKDSLPLHFWSFFWPPKRNYAVLYTGK